MISVIVPTLGRAFRLHDVVADIAANTAAGHEILVVAERDDEATVLAACREPGIKPVLNARSRNYAGAVNTGYLLASGQYLFTAADDLRFHPGWDAAALAALGRGFLVAGTNDLLNEYVAAGVHATHYLIDRSYIDQRGGVHGRGPGTVLNEAYDHNFTDTEFIGVARARGVFTPCLESVVEHRHANKGAPWDATYEKGRAKAAQDEALFRSREPMWTSDLSGVL